MVDNNDIIIQEFAQNGKLFINKFSVNFLAKKSPRQIFDAGIVNSVESRSLSRGGGNLFVFGKPQTAAVFAENPLGK